RRGYAAIALNATLPGVELGDLSGLQQAQVCARDIEAERAEFRALDFFHVVADRVEHAADLAIAPLCEDDFVPGIRSIFSEADFRRRGFYTAAVVERDGDSSTQAGQRRLTGLAADLDEIGFRYVLA